MTRELRVVVVNGSPNAPSKTMALADLVVRTLANSIAISVSVVDVYGLGATFTGAVLRDDVSVDVEAQIRAVETADVVIAATPVYRASYAGMFKHFFDLVDQYGLTNTPVILVATGGSDRHALVIDYAMRPLFAFFQAATAPVGFYANAGDFDGTIVLNSEVYSRIEVGLGDILPSLRSIADSVVEHADGLATTN